MRIYEMNLTRNPYSSRRPCGVCEELIDTGEVMAEANVLMTCPQHGEECARHFIICGSCLRAGADEVDAQLKRHAGLIEQEAADLRRLVGRLRLPTFLRWQRAMRRANDDDVLAMAAADDDESNQIHDDVHDDDDDILAMAAADDAESNRIRDLIETEDESLVEYCFRQPDSCEVHNGDFDAAKRRLARTPEGQKFMEQCARDAKRREKRKKKLVKLEDREAVK
jgi:hypothetical protein